MTDKDKTKEQLIDELVQIRQRNAELQERLGERALEITERTHELSKRAKELNCLYTASNLMAEQDWTLSEVFQGIVYLIQDSWQDPATNSGSPVCPVL